MSLVMSSLDYEHAPLELRGKLAFSGDEAKALMRAMTDAEGVDGAVLISTCNRTELYLSGENAMTPWKMLCKYADVPKKGMEKVFVTEAGEDAIRHLMEVSCGLCSQIRGEDQILTQVRNAMDLAHDAETSNSELSATFRMAVTVGKRVRDKIPVQRASMSLGDQCRDVLEKELGGLHSKNVLVIGNGQMGRLAAEVIHNAGANVTMTLRSYKHKAVVVPKGCGIVEYDNRMEFMDGIDAVVSATTSPHFTVLEENVRKLKNPPKVFVDLAVPRDIDTGVEKIPGVILRDMDTIGTMDRENYEYTRQIHEMIDEQMESYRHWKRNSAPPDVPYHFPVFIDLRGKKVVVVGGGTIGKRRINTLRMFGCDLTVIAPEIDLEASDFTWIRRPYEEGDLDGAALAVAATDDRQVNFRVGEDAKALGIPVSVADNEKECTFFFPAICTGEEVIAGVVSRSRNHHAVARAAKDIRNILERNY